MPRQAPAQSLASGRVNQKLRTRTAIVEAARELIGSGVRPTVAQAAEAALVSRTTAYRYFPTQESLLVEVSMNVDVHDIEELVAEPVDLAGAAERTVAVLDRLNEHVLASEVEYRNALRIYLDRSLAATDDGKRPVIREGRRTRWYETTLAPLRGHVPDADVDRLVASLSMLCGGEAIVVLRDVCGLDGHGALAVTRWAAAALVDATLRTADVPT